MSAAPKKNALQKLASLAEKGGRIKVRAAKSFADFLERFAKARTHSGTYVPYGFKGRRPLLAIVRLIDRVLSEGIKDGRIAICGGAQFGKTILVLNLFAFLMGWRFLNVTYFLPDEDLITAVVDTKFRPDVLDQVPEFNQLLTIGKEISESGKQVNRKGAMIATDGERIASGYMRGLNKIPTSLSADVVIVDERDDINPKFANYIPGRLTNSLLRLIISIGTQRIHAAGQNKEFLDGTQEVWQVPCPHCGAKHNPEELFPGIIRMAMDGKPAVTDLQLSLEGDFRRAGQKEAGIAFDPEAFYYLACPHDGTLLDADQGEYEARKPGRAKLKQWSIRISQLDIPAIELVQIVADWCNNATRDPEAMIAFFCDRLGIPKNTNQELTPDIVSRSQKVEDVLFSLAPSSFPMFGGLDMGDRCWFTAREVESWDKKRLRWAEQISSGQAITRVPLLVQMLGIQCLFIDLRPEANLARKLCFILNGIEGWKAPLTDDPEKSRIEFPGGLVWDGRTQEWSGLRCAVVEFSLKDTQGVRQRLGKTDDGFFYPLIQCNRNMAIQGAVDEFLTPTEGVIESNAKTRAVRMEPSMRIPALAPGAPKALQTFIDHILVGSQKDKAGDFVDKVENHFLLSDAYSRLAERISTGGPVYEFVKPEPVTAGENMDPRSVMI